MSSRNRRVAGTAAVAAGLVLLVLALLALIGPLSWWLVREDASRLTAAQLGAVKDTRTLLVQALGGLILAGGLAVTVRTYVLTREGQLTSRFSQAIELLGSPEADVRVGGIFALERIAKDSPRDRQTIVETLQTFLHAHAAAPATAPPFEPGQAPRSDVLAAARVLTRPVGGQPLQLAGVQLSGAELPEAVCLGADLSRSLLVSAGLAHAKLDGADLSRADLSGARLSHGGLAGAKLMRANLADADLTKANLASALLHQASLRRALLAEADLSYADLYTADLRRAQLAGADLRGAILISADLRDADLSGADIRDADFSDAKLDGAVLHGVDLSRAPTLTAEQIAAATTEPTLAPLGARGRGRR